MLRRALLDLSPELFPDLGGRMPQSVEDWVRYFSQGDEGAQRLAALLRALGRQGYEPAQRRRLHEHFATTRPGITADQLDKFLYRRRLSAQGRELIVRYLWEQGLLPEAAAPGVQTPQDLLNQVHRSLAGFWDIPEDTIAGTEERLAGRYWIYRASAHEPGQYVRGLLTVHPRVQVGHAMRMSEHYRSPGNPDEGQYERHSHYEGLVLEKAYRPVMISCLRLPAHRGEAAQTDLSCMRFTFIALSEAHVDGRVTSMRGYTTSSYRSGRFLASPVCFERIPEGFPRAVEGELKTLAAGEVPAAVMHRLNSFVTANGLTQL